MRQKHSFLDECVLNLHTSINYGYTTVGNDPVIYQPASKGKNLSLLAIISANGLKHYEIKDGSFATNSFISFLQNCHSKNVFFGNPLVVMDNVPFHKTESVKRFFESINIELMYLSPYSTDLNLIEMFFDVSNS